MTVNSPGTIAKRIHNHGLNVINVSNKERAISVILGLLFVSRGIKKASLLRAAIGGYLLYRGSSGHCPVYAKLQRSEYTSKPESVNIQTTVIVNKPKDEVYKFWRNLENLPLFMKHLKSVKESNEKRSHWELHVPGNVTLMGWDAEIVKEEPGALIAWRSLPGAMIENAGKVSFRDALGHGATELTVVITYKPPAGYIGSTLAWLLHPVFKSTIEKDILGFKEYAEQSTVSAI